MDVCVRFEDDRLIGLGLRVFLVEAGLIVKMVDCMGDPGWNCN